MILIINTADESKVFIGLAKNDNFLIKKEFQAKFRQAEKLLVEINKLLSAKNYQLKTIRGIAVVTGPGPFTALRIGIATANTLAYGLKVPIIGIKLTEFVDLSGLLKISWQKINKGKLGNIIKPFYGKEPNITLKKGKK